MKETTFEPVSWAHGTNIYEVNVRQYTDEGTFNAFAAHLPRLRDMGVGVLWFMPVTPIADKNRKGSLGSYYACSDYTSINPEFGTLEDFTALVQQAHDLGLKVIIDWVANHTGYGHTWTRTHPEYYNVNEKGEFFDANGWDDVIGLNYSNENLHFAMIDAMKFWVNTCHIDGFRCDMAHLVPLDFWKHARRELERIRKLFWLAETEEIAYHEVFDVSYTWKWLHAMEAFEKGKLGIGGLDKILTDYKTQFPPTAFRAFFTSNHDENSHSGSEYERLRQNAENFAVLCATWDGIPLLYSGQEAANRKRLAFFERDPIDYSGGFTLHDFYRTLLQLKEQNPALRAVDDAVQTHRFMEGQPPHTFSFIKQNGNDLVLVVLNFGNTTRQLNLYNNWFSGPLKEVFTGATYTVGGSDPLEIGAYGYRVFEKTND